MSFWSDKPLRRGGGEEEEEEEEELDDDNIAEAVDKNIPSQPLITDSEVQEISNNEEEENNSAVAVEVSEEVTDMQVTVTEFQSKRNLSNPNPNG